MLAPTNPLVMWAFTSLNDPRWRLLAKYLVLRQDPDNSNPQKLGSFNQQTWGAYLLNGELFVKRYEANGRPRTTRISAAPSRRLRTPISWSWKRSGRSYSCRPGNR